MKQIVPLFLFFLLLVASSVAQDGTVDTTFGGVKVRNEITGTYDQIASLVVRDDGQVFAIGNSLDNSFMMNSVLMKYFADGTLDESFGTQGKVITPLDGSGHVSSAHIRTDGKIVIAGTISVEGDDNAYLAAYNQDGTLDAAFGSGGIVTTPVGSYAELSSVFINSNNGQIMACGMANGQLFAVYRYNPDGSLDSTFGTNGITDDDLTGGGEGWLNTLAYNSGDGTIIVGGAGYTPSDFAAVIARYTDSGVLDTTFGNSGIVTVNFGGLQPFVSSVLLQTDGKVIVVGGTGNGSGLVMKIARYSSAGVPDSTFGIDGVVTIQSGIENYASSADLQSDGKIVVAGSIDDDAVVIRLDTAGALDGSFSGDGIRYDQINGIKTVWNSIAVKTDGTIAAGGYADSSGAYAFAYANYTAGGELARTGRTVSAPGVQGLEWNSVVVQPDGRSVATGAAVVNGVGVVLTGRFTSDGFPDDTFGTNGYVETSFAGLGDEGVAIAVQPDEKIVVAAKIFEGADIDFGVVRYNTNGTLDASFGGGVQNIDIGGNDHPSALAIQPNGKILIGGESIASSAVFAIARFNTDGTVDTDFGTAGKVTTNIPSTDGAYIRSLALQSNGKIIALGSNLGSNAYFVLARYDSTGAIDSTFGMDGNGIITSYFEYNSFGNSVLVLPDDKIVTGGTSFNGSHDVFTIARYTSSGIIDSSFGVDGVMKTTIGASFDQLSSVVLQTDGKIIAAGLSNDIDDRAHAAFVRYNSNGSIDTDFGSGGIALTEIYDADDNRINSIAIQPDARIVAAGYVYRNLDETSDGLLMRLNATSTPLPVELTSFTAQPKVNGVELLWSTATEVNNYGFEIQRKQIPLNPPLQGGSRIRTADEAGGFEKVGFVHGNGTANSPKTYSFTDAAVQRNGKMVYRLKQIDNDGKFEYSSEVEVMAGQTPKAFALEQNFPNPFNPSTTISFSIPNVGMSEKTSLRVYDALGREVATLVNEVKEAGSYSATFNASNLASGIYFARLQSNGKQMMKKMLLIK